MSYAAKRAELASALNSAGVVKAYAVKPSSPKTGDAWIRLGNSTRVNGLFEDEWMVFIILPQDATGAAADKWRDANQDLLIDALEDNCDGYVDEIIPVNLGGTDTNPQFGLQINFRSE